MSRTGWIIGFVLGLCVQCIAVHASPNTAGLWDGGLHPMPAIEPRSAGGSDNFANLVRQQTDFSCGAAALATILKYAHGLDVEESSVLAGLLGLTDRALAQAQGFTLLDLKRYVESLGLSGQGYRVGFDELRNAVVPSIVLLEIEGYRHFVVLRRVTGSEVHIADPALGNRAMTLEAFRNAWVNGVIFTVTRGSHDLTAAGRARLASELAEPQFASRNVSTPGPRRDSPLPLHDPF